MPAAGKIVRTGSIIYPRVQVFYPQAGKGSYMPFIHAITDIRGNREAFAVLDKPSIDAEFERQLRGVLHDEPLVQRFMTHDARSEQSERMFLKLQKKIFDVLKPVAVTQEVSALNLPNVCNHPKNQKYKIFDRQTYADFATKAEKRNPGFEFSKSTMDQAFELMARKFARSPSSKKAAQGGAFEGMMARCLGKESDRYWKTRES